MRVLTADETAVLTAAKVEVTPGLELLDATLQVVEDLTDDLVGGSVTWSLHADIHRTCRLTLSRALSWPSSLVRPYVTVSADGVDVRCDQGAFVLTTPESPIGLSVPVYDVAGYDRLYLLRRPVGDSYSVASGASVVAAMTQAFADAGMAGYLVDGTSAAAVLPQAMVWPLTADSEQVTWLRVLNDLAESINYRAIWCDDLGRFRAGPYVNPADRPVEFTFTTDDPHLTVVGDRTLLEEHWARPNVWVFVQRNRTTAPTEGDGIYTVDLSAGSDLHGGLDWRDVISVDVADQTSLEAFGDRSVAARRRVSRTLRVVTGPWPAAGHADVYQYLDPAVGSLKVQCIVWEQDLGPADGVMEWEVVA